MSASSEGYCIIGFQAPRALFVDEVPAVSTCRTHGDLRAGDKFCPQCGQKGSPVWSDLAAAVAAHLGLELPDYIDVLDYVFEGYYAKGILGVSLKDRGLCSEHSYIRSQEQIEAAFTQARRMAELVYPGENPAIGLHWGYSLF